MSSAIKVHNIRNLHSLVTHELYQILGVEKAKARAAFPHCVCIRYCAQILKPPVGIV